MSQPPENPSHIDQEEELEDAFASLPLNYISFTQMQADLERVLGPKHPHNSPESDIKVAPSEHKADSAKQRARPPYSPQQTPSYALVEPALGAVVPPITSTTSSQISDTYPKRVCERDNTHSRPIDIITDESSKIENDLEERSARIKLEQQEADLRQSQQ